MHWRDRFLFGMEAVNRAQAQRGRDQGPLLQRHRRDDGGHVRARRLREGAGFQHRDDRPRHRLDRDPVDVELVPQERHDPAHAPRRARHLHAAEEPRRVVPRHRQVAAARRRRPPARRHRGRQARGRSDDRAGLLQCLPRRGDQAGPAARPLLRPGLGGPAQGDAGRLGRHPRRADAPAAPHVRRRRRAAVRRRHHRPPDGHPGGRHRQPRRAGSDGQGAQRGPRLCSAKARTILARGGQVVQAARSRARDLEGRELQLHVDRHARLRPHRHRLPRGPRPCASPKEPFRSCPT